VRASVVNSENVSAPQLRSGVAPAIWTAFARAGRWKTWALFASFGLNALLALAAIGFADRTPDVVLVDPTGKSTYVPSGVASEALMRFLQEQRQLPSDVTVAHFTSDFLKAFLGTHSSTAEEGWAEALSAMDASLRSRMAKEASEQKLIETYRLAQMRAELEFEDIQLVERKGSLLNIRALVRRRRVSLVQNQPPQEERLRIELLERVVPRTLARPDGLEVVEYRNELLPKTDPSAASDALPGAAVSEQETR
jgi:hypothetical protein